MCRSTPSARIVPGFCVSRLLPEGRVRRPIKAARNYRTGTSSRYSSSLLIRYVIPIVGSHKYSRGIRYAVARVNEPMQPLCNDLPAIRSRCVHGCILPKRLLAFQMKRSFRYISPNQFLLFFVWNIQWTHESNRTFIIENSV